MRVVLVAAAIVFGVVLIAQGAPAQSGVKWVPLNGAQTSQSPHPAEPRASPQAAAPDTAATAPIPEDLALLQGKKVVVGRVALCVPNTFQANLNYAGKTATVVGFKPNQTLSSVNLGMIPASARAMIENQKKGGVLVLQFEDGTKLDTCAPQGSNQLSANLDLAPGETLPIGSVGQSPIPSTTSAMNGFAGAPAATAASSPQACPVDVIKVSAGDSFGHMLVDALTTSELQRQIDEVNHGGVGKHYLDVQFRNDSGKPVRAFEFSAVYANSMGDEGASATFQSQNGKSIRPAAIFKTYAMDREFLMQNGRGDVTVYVDRVRFEDDSLWQDNGSRSCALKASLK